MKWFKHDSDAFMSEGVDALISEFGFAGYGRWNRLLEIVASKMDESNRCHVEYSMQKWCSLLGLKQKKLISFLELTKNQLKTKVVRSENKVRIEIPNLLKKRDNYTKHLQVESKQLPSIDKEVDKEVDNKKKGGKKTKKPAHPEDLFGEHKNVKLTKIEYKKLQDLTAPNHLGNYIEKLSDWLASSGKKKKSHYATLRTWLRNDGLLKKTAKKIKPKKSKPEPVLTEKDHKAKDEAMKAIKKITH